MRRFVAISLATLLGLVLAVGGCNLLVDPFGAFGSPRIAGFNRDKTEAIWLPRLAKAYLVDRVSPGALLLGSSRVDLGFDPASPAWSGMTGPVFNLGLPGSDPFVNYRYLQHVLQAARPSLVVLGLVFEDTIRSAPARLAAADVPQWDYDGRMRTLADGSPNPDLQAGRLRDGERMLLSLAAIGDSAMTVLNQGNPHKGYVTKLGFTTSGDFTGLVANEGHGAIFAAKDADKATKLARLGGHADYDLSAVDRIIRLSRANGARVILAILPNHADGLRLLYLAGLMPDYLRWTADLAATADRAGDGVALWDFDGYSAWTTEPIPPRGDRTTQMQWFWEADHFKPVLGELMIARMMGTSDVPFGVRLTGGTVEPALDAFSEGQSRFAAARPADVARLDAVYAAAARTVRPMASERPLHVVANAGDGL